MDKQIFAVRSVSATLKGSSDGGKAASLALQRFGFAPQGSEGSICKSVPREGERFLVQVDEKSSNRFFLYRANAKIGKWDNVFTGYFTRPGAKQEADGSRIFSGTGDKFEMVSFATDPQPITKALKDIPVGSPAKSMGVVAQAASQSRPPHMQRLSQQEIAEYSASFLQSRSPDRQQPYAIMKAILHLVNGGCDDVSRVSALLNVCVGTVYRGLQLKSLPSDWIEKLNSETPRSMRFTVGELIELSKIADVQERQKKYSILLAEKARSFEEKGTKKSDKRAMAVSPAELAEVQQYVAQFIAKRASGQKLTMRESQVETIEAILWCAKRGLNGNRISDLTKVSTITVYKYLHLTRLPEEWLARLSLALPEEERLSPQDALVLSAIEDADERKKRYEDILAQHREEAQRKKVLPAKRTYVRRTETEAVVAPPTATTHSPAPAVTMTERVEEIRKWIRQGREIVTEVKKKGDNKLPPPIQAELLESLRGLQKVIGDICAGKVFQKEDPWPQDVRYLAIQLGPILDQAEALADELIAS